MLVKNSLEFVKVPFFKSIISTWFPKISLMIKSPVFLERRFIRIRSVKDARSYAYLNAQLTRLHPTVQKGLNIQRYYIKSTCCLNAHESAHKTKLKRKKFPVLYSQYKLLNNGSGDNKLNKNILCMCSKINYIYIYNL
jgi:hypothetical protein